MYDSVTVSCLPANTTMAGAYVDGMYANEAAVRARFPKAKVVTITVTGLPGANVCDCETGDLTPEQAVNWAASEKNAGRSPTIYCNSSTWPQVKQLCMSRNIDVSFWIADYDNNPVIPKGAVAKQYRSDTAANLDYSIVADYWPGVDTKPTIDEEFTVRPEDEATFKKWVAEVLDDRVRIIIHGIAGDPTHQSGLDQIKTGVDKVVENTTPKT